MYNLPTSAVCVYIIDWLLIAIDHNLGLIDHSTSRKAILQRAESASRPLVERVADPLRGEAREQRVGFQRKKGDFMVDLVGCMIIYGNFIYWFMVIW